LIGVETAHGVRENRLSSAGCAIMRM
jgi:hypothetical protein